MKEDEEIYLKSELHSIYQIKNVLELSKELDQIVKNQEKMLKGKIGNLVSYAPASANNVSTDIPKHNGKVGAKNNDWDVWVKTTEWYRLQHASK